MVYRAQTECLARHSEYDATGFILRDCLGPGPLHFEQSLGSVRAHAGQKRADRIPAGGGSHGFEQNIHRGALVRDARARPGRPRGTRFRFSAGSYGNCPEPPAPSPASGGPHRLLLSPASGTARSGDWRTRWKKREECAAPPGSPGTPPEDPSVLRESLPYRR
jgi:hypothetical protein